ncbi:ATP-dependent DNA helicase RecQ [Roseivirga ehrenbergii]|uniref:ATP-dependent DNA helicase RecQ n=1 Tax=Roseivirga ehrenbergii (strain DSM 102268 / JCM 13514 / KCTC 12282 / NCIMB 14502 / KMM 6017) TaxID=279360 RepID=A0A150XTI3_ROSEK|nr:ATP-dependent DNA helicase RecQ [Roseivirga ehrenbergii]KYG81984.1 recombinase RecQ [Roseivirga ehrenbergii]TCL01802.1 ATP-dependent DNA helicase RecQ [Roseivirga ehrenbergii]
MNQGLNILKKYWGYNAFRPLQEDIINASLEGNDVLALLPTGGGKSICFQVPALVNDGLCVVISPLIALMKDQVYQLKRRGITAESLHAGMSKREIDFALDNCVNADIKFLYVSPERLKTELFQERIKIVRDTRGVNLIAVDEAHCISQWGYDFRPAYLEIAAIRELLPETPIMALTATATEKVKADIQEKLEFRNKKVFTKSFARANLSYSVRFEEHKERKLLEVLNRVRGSAVVYVSTRRHAKELALMLQRSHISADFYHAGLTHEERSLKQENWIHNRTQVIVSTNAFGMGIDKPDVRLVVHMDLPGNLEAYYQEAGRAGRDEKKAYAVIICHQKDIEELRKKTKNSLPDVKLIREVYQMLGNYYQLANGSHPQDSFDFDFQTFSKNFDRHPMEIFNGIKVLESQGAILLSESFYQPSRLMFGLNQKLMYEFQIANAQFDPLIKAILRLYGGEVYNNLIIIQENNLAANLGLTVDACRKMLKHLHEREVLEYIPQKDQPQLSFLMPKYPADKLSIDNHQIESRRKLITAKMESVIAYLHNEERCRTQQLLEYFGEVNYDPCLVCDNCVQNKRKAEELKLRAKYETQIFSLLDQSTEFDVNGLVNAIAPENKNVLTTLVAELVDHGVLKFDEFGKLEKGRKNT